MVFCGGFCGFSELLACDPFVVRVFHCVLCGCFLGGRLFVVL